MRLTLTFKESYGCESITHLITHPSSFIAPILFPGVQTLADYADTCRVLLDYLPDLAVHCMDSIVAKDDQVAIRYTISGSHSGQSYWSGLGKEIPASGRKACWTGMAFFCLENGKIKTMMKEFNKFHVWTELGWPTEDLIIPNDFPMSLKDFPITH